MKADYLAVFMSAFLGSATVLFPGFNPFLVFINAKFLNPYLLGIIAGIGWGIGESTGYIIGLFGERALKFLGEKFYNSVINGFNKAKIRFQNFISWICRFLGIKTGSIDWISVSNFKKHGFIIIFLATLFPNPFIEAFTFTAGIAKYNPARFLLASILGRTVLSFALIAFQQKIIHF